MITSELPSPNRCLINEELKTTERARDLIEDPYLVADYQNNIETERRPSSKMMHNSDEETAKVKHF